MYKRICITLLFLLLYWAGRFIPVSGVSYAALKSLTNIPNMGYLELIMRRISIFSLDIMPYLSTHIIFMLLIAVVPPLRNRYKNGALGIRKINQFIYVGVILLSLIQAFFLSLWMESFGKVHGIYLVSNPGIIFRMLSILSITGGVLVIIWMANQINKYGIGNGISLFIISGLLMKFRHLIPQMVKEVLNSSLLKASLGLLLFISFVGLIIFMLRKYKTISVSIPGKNSKDLSMTIPFNLGGILPIYFTSSILLFPATVMVFSGKHVNSASGIIGNILTPGTWGSYLVWVVSIIFFAYFCTAVVFNPVELVPKLKHFGLSIPGRDTEKSAIEYLDNIVTKIIFIWSIFLCGVAFLPVFLHRLLHVHIPFTGYELVSFIGIILGIYYSFKNQGNLKEVFRHSDLKEVLVIKTKLESEGIAVTIVDCESYGRVLSLLVGPLAEKKILVNESDHNKSTNLIG